MVQVTKRIALEVSKPNPFKVIVAKQGDNRSRFLKVTICDDTKKIIVPQTATVIINALRDDEESKMFAGVVNSDGSVTVPLTAWMLEFSGIITSDISIIDEEGRKLSTTSFTIEVEKAACADDDISEDDNYDILIKLIDDVRELQENDGIDFLTNSEIEALLNNFQ